VRLSCEQGQEGSGTCSTLWNVVASCTCAARTFKLGSCYRTGNACMLPTDYPPRT
jgi:hypothetical protein